MAAKQKTRLIVGVVGIVVAVIGGALYVNNALQPTSGKITGTITELDLNQRTATLEFIHPKTGKRYELVGTVSPDCVITRDGEQIALDALAVGTTVSAEGLLYRASQQVVATRVEVLAEPDIDPNAVEASDAG